MKIKAFSAVCFLNAALNSVFTPCYAQGLPTPPPAAKPVDPKVTAAQAAFEALPEQARIAIQNDLVWTTPFSGAALGTFGRLTYEAISTFQKQANQPVDGILTDKQRITLADASRRARQALLFAIQTDPVTGSGIGIATKLLSKQEKTPIGSKWSSDNGDVVLETVRTAPDKADMAATFERFVNAATPGRKVTYKLLRPDFFVVTGEMGTKKFYTRFAPTSEGLRGYTLTYEAARSAEIDRVVIAIANTFQPLKQTGQQQQSIPQAPSANALPSAALSSIGAPASPIAQSSTQERLFTATMVAADKALSSAKAVDGCKILTIAGKPVQLLTTDAVGGLSLIGAAGLSPNALAWRETELKPGEALFALGFDNSASRKLSLAPGEALKGADGRASLPVALQSGSGGALIADRAGNAAGLVLDLPLANRQIAGVIPLASYVIASSRDIRLFLEKNGVKTSAPAFTEARTAGDVATSTGKSVVAVSCRL